MTKELFANRWVVRERNNKSGRNNIENKKTKTKTRNKLL